MNNLIKVISASLMFLAIASCNKDDDNAPVPNKQLLKIKSEYNKLGTESSDIREFIYNGENKLELIKTTDNEGDVYEIGIIYSGDKIIQKNNYKNNVLQDSTIFEYTSNKLLAHNKYNDANSNRTDTFTIDSRGLILVYTSKTTTTISKYHNENLMGVRSALYSFTYQYDNKKSIYTELNNSGFPKWFKFYFDWFESGTNNRIKENYNMSLIIANGLKEYSYEYDADGYPIKAKITIFEEGDLLENINRTYEYKEE